MFPSGVDLPDQPRRDEAGETYRAENELGVKQLCSISYLLCVDLGHLRLQRQEKKYEQERNDATYLDRIDRGLRPGLVR